MFLVWLGPLANAYTKEKPSSESRNTERIPRTTLSFVGPPSSNVFGARSKRPLKSELCLRTLPNSPFAGAEPLQGPALAFKCCFTSLQVLMGQHPGDHNHQDFPKSTAIQMGGVLQYKWEAYCDTNGRSTDSLSLSLEPRGTKSTAIQMGGVLRYEWELYCDTFLRSSGGWGFRHSSDLR